jgi:hypothetical protein
MFLPCVVYPQFLRHAQKKAAETTGLTPFQLLIAPYSIAHFSRFVNGKFIQNSGGEGG